MIELLFGMVSLALLGFGIYYAIEALRIRRRVMHTLSEPSHPADSKGQRLAKDKSHNGSYPYIRPAEQALAILLNEQMASRINSADREEILDGYRWLMTKIVDRAAERLNSSNPEEVLAGCVILSLYGDSRLIPYFEKLQEKWKGNDRVVRQIKGTRSKLKAIKVNTE